MSEPDTHVHMFDKPRNVKRVLMALYVLCAGSFVADFIIHRHGTWSWETLPGFYPIYGFVACVALVLLAKEMRKVVMRSEDYYDNDADR